MCLTLCDSLDYSPTGSSVHWDFPGKNTGVGCHALLQGTFPIQESNGGLLLWRQILHHLNHQGSPRILAWVAYPFSRGSSQPRNQAESPTLPVVLYKLRYQGSPLYFKDIINLHSLVFLFIYSSSLLFLFTYSSLGPTR